MRNRLRIGLLAITAATVAAVGLPSGAAGAEVDPSAACPERPVAPYFARMLDPILYFRMPGGDFESGQGAWGFTGAARIESGNQTLMPADAGDSHSVVLPPGSAIRSEELCVEGAATVMRFFARPKGLLGLVVVTVTATDEAGNSQTLISPAISLASSWSAPQALFRLPLLGDHLTKVRYEIRSVGLSAVSIDDIYIDPLRQR